MIRPPLLAALVLAAPLAPAAEARDPTVGDIADDFERGLRVGVPDSPWAIAQQVRGRVSVAPALGRRGRALRAEAAAKANGVAKADVVARIAPLRRGEQVTIAFDAYFPAGTPLDSLQLADLECATCGEAGNPGIRLYLRRGRLRVDRSKIGVRHAWTDDAAAPLSSGRWHRITWQVRLSDGEDGATRVLLDGREVLAARGATAAPLPRVAADRVQIGITANSNPVAAVAWFDDVAISRR